MSREKNIPTTPGYYWARSKGSFEWYNMIVNIYGESPFFKLYGWVRGCMGDDGVRILDIDDIYDFGPKIEEAEVPQDRIDKSIH